MHKETGVTLFRCEVDSLRHVDLEANLAGASFRDQKLDGVDFTLTNLNDADFAGASCIKAVFYSVHLQRADFTGTRLWGIDGDGADLRHAVLRSAQMEAAWLGHAALTDADLRNADLKAAYLAHASLNRSDLRGANLTEAVLHRTNLTGADLTGATFCSTVIADCPTLYRAKGLAAITHAGPSSIDHITLRACVAHLPDAFLRGVGYSEEDLQILRKLYQGAS